MTTTGEVIAVYRQCKHCDRWRRTGSFWPRNAHVCGPCYKPFYGVGNRGALSRSIAITDKGRAYLRSLAA